MTLKNRLFNWLPPQNKTLYQFCRRYLDRYDGVNNSDMATNGEQRVLQTVLPRCTLVFDVGANVGDWTKSALSFNSQLIVHAFEPHAATFATLASQPFPAQVVRQPFGFGAVEEEKVLHVMPGHTGMNSLYTRTGLPVQPHSADTIPITIQLKTIDGYCHTHDIEMIDFLKIDVEGHELAVLSGAQTMLQNGRLRLIQFEYGGTSLDARVFLKDFFELLQPMNYQLYKIFPDHLQHVPAYLHSLETFQYQNWLAVHTTQGSDYLE
ncbi:MAG: FkbM family methyltransferase [Anaerolineae bacterium]|nr:FkbM family methyltransferase [Anaerolineae bacterium]